MTSQKCLSYLTDRKISLATARKLQIGYFGISDFSRFSDRMLFPVRDLFGNLLTFQGRAMYDHLYEGQPKYWHESFLKGEHLYGLYENADLIVDRNYAVLVEGPFDVAALAECGIPAVAILGSAFSETHAWLLRQHTDYVFEWLDADPAGRKAAKNASAILAGWGISHKSLAYGDKDPATTLVIEGKAKLARRIQF